MSSNDKQESIATQVKEDGINEKEKCAGDAKSETSPQKRPASELNNADGEVKHKHIKTDHKDEKENGADEKYEEDGDDDDDAVPDDYDEEGEEGGDDEDGADEDEEEEDDA